MRVLWFTNTPSMYDQGKHAYNGGGWIESLEALMFQRDAMELGIGFFHPTDSLKRTVGKTTYYPILRKVGKKNPFNALLSNWSGRIENAEEERMVLNVVEDFAPDVIHIFGTEDMFGLIGAKTKIPVVIHLQGLLNPYANAYFSAGESRFNYVMDSGYLVNNVFGNSPTFMAGRMKREADRERGYLTNASYVMGRTHWDKMIAEIYNPAVTYYHVDEVLRPVFYGAQWNKAYVPGKPLIITSTLSATTYKGLDVILKTARLLKEQMKFAFEWRIAGLNEDSKMIRHFEKQLQISHKEVGLQFLGKKGPAELIALLQDAHVFIHPSYIDNSPNSVCEAQVLGLPIIACAVGGVPSLIQHEVSGILVPSNGIFEIVHYLNQYIREPEKFRVYGLRGRETALKRHDTQKIVDDILKVYTDLVA